MTITVASLLTAGMPVALAGGLAEFNGTGLHGARQGLRHNTGRCATRRA